MTVFILADHCNLRSGIVQLTRGDWLTASGDISSKGANKISIYFAIIFIIFRDYIWNRGLNCQLLHNFEVKLPNSWRDHVQTPVYNKYCHNRLFIRHFYEGLLWCPTIVCCEILLTPLLSTLSSPQNILSVWCGDTSHPQTECCWAVLKWEIRSHSRDRTLRAAPDTVLLQNKFWLSSALVM